MANAYNLKKLWENYLYMVDISIETPSGLTKLENMQIHSLYIEKDFDNSYLPIFLVNLSLQKDLYYDIINNHTATKFIIQIDKYIDPANTGRPKSKKVYIRDKFVPIIDNKTPFTDEKFYKTMKYGGGSKIGKQIIPYDLNQRYDFILVREADLLAMQKSINSVFSSINMVDLLTVVLGNAGVSNVLMSNLDNTTSYSELLTLPIPTLPQLKYINEYYGLYKEGAQIFFDIDRMYILRNTPECTAWVTNEIKDVAFTINPPSSGEDVMIGSVVDQDQKTIFMNIGKDRVMFMDKTTGNDIITGSDTTLVNTVDGSVSSVKPNASKIGSSTVNVRTTNTMNKYKSSELNIRQSELRNIVNIVCNQVDISHLTPNKKYKILTTIPTILNKVKGDYRLCKTVSQFAKEGDHFNVITNIELRRPK